MESIPKFFTIAEAANHLRISRSTVYNLLKAGHLPLRKIGSKSLIAAADIDAFADALPAVNRAA